jgi:hypothetical protein
MGVDPATLLALLAGQFLADFFLVEAERAK